MQELLTQTQTTANSLNVLQIKIFINKQRVSQSILVLFFFFPTAVM